MSAITEMQNDDESLTLLRASSTAYGQAKVLWGLQLGVAAIVGIAGSVLAFKWPGLKPWVATAGLGVILMDTFILEAAVQHYRTLGAKFQERFDTRLFRMVWNDLLAGSQPSTDEVQRFGGKSPATCDSSARNWYPTAVAGMPHAQAVLVCQRSNAAWDSALRRAFSTILAIVLLCIVVVGVVLGLMREWRFEDWLLALAVPSIPFALRIAKDRITNARIAAESAKLREKLDAALAAAKSGAVEEPAVTGNLRMFQDDLYRRRSTSPFVPNWFYRLRRRKDEDVMAQTAAALSAPIPAAEAESVS